MGVLNCTPDSFSDGGQFLDERSALRHAERLLTEGAELLDLGAESTRPGAPRVSAEEQLARLGGLIRTLVGWGAAISIDTTLPAVAARALDDGACLVNSVELGPAFVLAGLAHRHDAALCLMHSRGEMTSMPGFSRAGAAGSYGDDVVATVIAEWSVARDEALRAGLAREDVLLDPGLGFHKSAEQSFALSCRCEELTRLGHPVLVGPSRKSYLAAVTALPGAALAPADRRLGGTIAACLSLAQKGVAVLRVHDVAEVGQALRLFEAERRTRAQEPLRA